MPATYPLPSLRDARMRAVRDAIAGGRLQIGSAGVKNVLAEIPLGAPAGEVKAGQLTLELPQYGAVAQGTGKAAAARIVDAQGEVAVAGLTVGDELESPAPDIVLSNKRIETGMIVQIRMLVITHY